MHKQKLTRVIVEKIIYSIKEDAPLLAVVICAFTMNVFFRHALTALLVAFTSSFLLQKYIKRQYFTSYISSIVIGFVGYLLALSFCSTILWSLHVKTPLLLLSFISLMMAYVLFVFTGVGTRLHSRRFADSSDFVAIIIMVLCVFAYSTGVMRSKTPDQTIRTVLAQNISFGVDDLTHLNMVKDSLEADRGLLLGSGNAASISKAETVPYPKMSHLIGAVLITHSNEKHTLPNDTMVLSYAITKLVLFLLAIYIFTRAICDLTSLKRFEKIAAATPLVGLCIFSFVQPFIQEGFFSVWPLLVVLPVAILVLAEHTKQSLQTSVLVGLITTILFMSWPIVALPFVGVLLFDFLGSLTKSVPRLMYVVRQLIGPAIGVVGCLQIYVQVFDKTPIDNGQAFNASGGIIGFPHLYLFIFGLLAGISVVKNARVITARALQLTVILLSGFALIVALIGVSNIASTGSIQYFYIKSAYIFLYTCSVLAVPRVCHLLSRIKGGMHAIGGNNLPELGSIFFASSAAALVFFLSFNIGTAYPRYAMGYLLVGTRHITTQDSQNLLNSGEETVIINQDSVLSTYYLSTASRSLNRFDYCLGDIHALLSTDSTILTHCTSTHMIHMIKLNDPTLPDEISSERISKTASILEASSIPFTLK